MKALVVFHGDGLVCLRPFLRPGFHHCFAALNDGRAWIIVDLTAIGLSVSADVSAGFDLAAHFRDLGMTVVETRRLSAAVRYRFWPVTCVGAVKRALGLRSHAVTPWQLHRHLVRRS